MAHGIIYIIEVKHGSTWKPKNPDGLQEVRVSLSKMRKEGLFTIEDSRIAKYRREIVVREVGDGRCY